MASYRLTKRRPGRHSRNDQHFARLDRATLAFQTAVAKQVDAHGVTGVHASAIRFSAAEQVRLGFLPAVAIVGDVHISLNVDN